ncbi:MAG: cytochrome c family protein [Roseitalea porphyridii]|uniref:Cytochrome c family protein n=1 Tax=Roseitalea porphyridii TaxID=1852022 RepID=A0A4P6V3Y5_9HYPH|nr:cytochrome c family protein [Roseitalea porphyridii]QBK31210.1 cytochrome c family protein [Roseitalea porphyridii]
MKSLKTFVIAAGAVLVSTSAYAIDGDPEAGEQVFRTCATCHNVEAEQNKVGPHLVNVFGRTPGTVEGFRYSRAMTQFGEEGNVWDEETLSAYLADPRGYVRGNRMAFVGLKSEEEIQNVLAYLAQFSEMPDAEGGEEAAEGEEASADE